MHETADQHVYERILGNNEEMAEHNRDHFDELGIFAVNLMSAPGAGKTSLLEHAIPKLAEQESVAVVEGDMVGELDAQRLRSTTTPVIQITTGRSCHLDALMVARVLHNDDFAGSTLLFIENVGNLVCPAEFPLGEHLRVVLLSVTEGDDKPLKYPVIFRNCDAVLFTKCDLLPYVDFSIEKATEYVKALNPETQTFATSVRSGQGLSDWLKWLREEKRKRLPVVPQG